MADQLFKKRQGVKRIRKEAVRDIEPFRYLIVCEGEKTEPNYFIGIKKLINDKFGNKIVVEDIKVDRIVIDGTGRNTEDLVRYAIERRKCADIPYGHVWCVFDKDSFSDEQFNDAIQNCENNGLKAAWTNEAIELWFLLHFEYLNTNIGRKQYNNKLDEYFKSNSINGGKYEKNIKNIYEILDQYSDISNAIKYAKKLEKGWVKESSYAKMNPATTVYKLVEDLFEYLEK